MRLRDLTVHPEQKQTSEVSIARELRKRRVTAVISEALSGLPDHVIHLNSLLKSPAVDLRQVNKIIRSDPTLHVRILSLANAAVASFRQSVQALTEAMVLLGSERLRTLVLSYAFTKLADRQLSDHSIQEFWRHSSLTATYSERIARGLGYPETEEAYVGGLMHDIGRVPLLIVAHEEKAKGDVLPTNWQDDLDHEREFFGIDHCEAGKWMAVAWGFTTSLIEVIQNHHAPLNATQESVLVEIVAAGDYYSGLPSAVTAGYRSEGSPLPVLLSSESSRPARITLIS